MTFKVSYVIILTAISLTSAATGYYIGEKESKVNMEKYYSDLIYMHLASDIKSQVKALTLLKEMEKGKAQTLLDNLLDISLATLSTYSTSHEKITNISVLSSIKDAKEYRKRFGRQVTPSLSRSVEKTFQLVK